MKKNISKLAAVTTLFFLITAVISLFSTGCSKENAAKKSGEFNSFSLAPYECNIIGEINVKKLSKLDVVKKQINTNKNAALVKELDSAGMGWDNISNLYFAISPISKIQDKTPVPGAVILIKTNNKVNISKLISIAERETKKKVTSEKIGNQTVYLIPQDDSQQVFMSELNDTLIALGSKSLLAKTIDLFNGKGQSVTENAELMKITDSANRNNMVWIGCVIGDDLLNAFGIPPSTIKAQGGLIYADYSENILTVGGNIKCATQQDAQKILMPAQMLSAMLVSNPKSSIKSEDISLSVTNNDLNIKISVTKQALEELAKQQMQNLPDSAPQYTVQIDKEVEQIIPPEPIKPAAPVQPADNKSTNLGK